MLLKYEFSAQDCDVKKYEERQSGGSVVVIKFTSGISHGRKQAGLRYQSVRW